MLGECDSQEERAVTRRGKIKDKGHGELVHGVNVVSPSPLMPITRTARRRESQHLHASDRWGISYRSLYLEAPKASISTSPSHSIISPSVGQLLVL